MIGNALLWCNITVIGLKKIQIKTCKYIHIKILWSFILLSSLVCFFIWFLFFFFFKILVYHTILCAKLIIGLCGIWVVGCFSWLHCFSVKGRHAHHGVTKGKCKTPLFSLLAFVFLMWRLLGFVKQYTIFWFLRSMKTIHVNITSQKNVYFYDLWVITLSFANKIFNDNLYCRLASWFGS